MELQLTLYPRVGRNEDFLVYIFENDPPIHWEPIPDTALVMIPISLNFHVWFIYQRWQIVRRTGYEKRIHKNAQSKISLLKAAISEQIEKRLHFE